jgi:hypothetical protein
MRREIAAGNAATLPNHTPQLTYIVLAPFTGPTEAVELIEAIRAKQAPGP